MASGEIHRRESERGLLQAAFEDQDVEGLEDDLATPPLQYSPSWSLTRSRINSYRVIRYLLDSVHIMAEAETQILCRLIIHKVNYIKGSFIQILRTRNRNPNRNVRYKNMFISLHSIPFWLLVMLQKYCTDCDWNIAL